MHRDVPVDYRNACLVILAIGFVLRFYSLGENDLWFDEAVYANNSYTDFSTFLERTRTQNSSPIILPYLYWLLGDAVRTAFSARVLPAIFSFLAVAVVLALPRAGLSRKATLMAAFWLAISPVQIMYAQEVREYSFSVLVAAAIIYAFCNALDEQRNARYPWLFAGLLGIAPLCSYGLCILAGALLVVYFLRALRMGTFSITRLFLIPLPLVVGVIAAFLTTARYQMYVAKADYLLHAYPPHEAFRALYWLVTYSVKYIAFATDGLILCVMATVLMALATWHHLKQKEFDSIQQSLMLALVLLMILSAALAFAGAFPFGGIRQHLFASPLVIICTANAAVFLAEKFQVRWMPFFASTASILLALTLPALPKSYAEHEDIETIVQAISTKTDDHQVFVYYNMQPAALFHFPERHFYLSKATQGDLAFMADEISRMSDCDIYLAFSHIYKFEDEKLIQLMLSKSYTVVSETRSTGARLVEMSGCHLAKS